jgi:hypothetical protein
MIPWPLFSVLFQKVTNGLVKKLVRRTLLVNGENLELFEQLAVNGCCKSLSFSHGFLYKSKGSSASKKSFDVICVYVSTYTHGRQTIRR